MKIGTLNPERSYWKQGDAGSGSGGGDVNESEDDPLKWIKDVKPDPLTRNPLMYFLEVMTICITP